MKTLLQLFSAYPSQVARHYLTKAINIEIKLSNGVNYHELNGVRILLDRDLIRFKLGIYRLIFKRNSNGYTPLFLIKRKNLERFLKRRCS